MKIHFNSAVAGVRVAYYAGETHEVPERQAPRFIARGIAVALPGVARRRRGGVIAETHLAGAGSEHRG